MLETFKRDDDRGQVGIGTLIVFIAMVLVAAIAAGVLINTAGFLQSGAEETGQQSSDQVTNRLQVVSSVGQVVNGDVDTVEVTVKRAPGAGNIDLSSTTLQFVHSSGATDLTFTDAGVGSGNADGTTFGVTSVQDDGGTSIEGSQPVLNDPADRAKITLDTNSIVTTGNGGLQEGDTATVQINTQSGGNTELRLVVPETLSGSSSVTL
ncbi:archaellin/type IV pilin N-terminal domain-containing protein [Haloarcula laminariae]|uniref:archaellin/type IV pilin N-terminal domain-containing protein n=1 Tax=Haloarcula laminariae TaxID=2961577 RepID=UPI0024052D74|nr:archaellin/type IV pilin N-terminal domain-containing protein [Halomicroarcula sp. FL173]